MDNNLILIKIKTLYKEYLQYKEYYDDFLTDVEKSKAEVAKRMASDDFEKELEEFVLDAFVLKNVYFNDLHILTDKIVTYANAARLLGLEDKIEEDIKNFISKNKEKEFRPSFIVEQEKLVEVSEGFVDEQRKNIREQGNIKTLIQRITK